MFMTDLYLAQIKIEEMHREAAQARRVNQARRLSELPVRRSLLRLPIRRQPVPTAQSRAA